MVHRKHKRQLHFEALESMELLSGVGMALDHPASPQHASPLAQVHRITNGSRTEATLNLSGTVQGTYRLVRHGSAAAFKGQGNLSPVGNVRLQGTVSLTSANSGKFVLNLGRRGKINVSVLGVASQGAYTYQITGGTRTFRGDTGGGLATGTLSQGTFTLILNPPI
jgi:hypothetical protein